MTTHLMKEENKKRAAVRNYLKRNGWVWVADMTYTRNGETLYLNAPKRMPDGTVRARWGLIWDEIKEAGK